MILAKSMKILAMADHLPKHLSMISLVVVSSVPAYTI